MLLADQHGLGHRPPRIRLVVASHRLGDRSGRRSGGFLITANWSGPVHGVGYEAKPGSTAGSRLRATENNSTSLKRAQTAEPPLKHTTWSGLWSRRPRVRVPSLTPQKPLLTAGYLGSTFGDPSRRGPTRGLDPSRAWADFCRPGRYGAHVSTIERRRHGLHQARQLLRPVVRARWWAHEPEARAGTTAWHGRGAHAWPGGEASPRTDGAGTQHEQHARDRSHGRPGADRQPRCSRLRQIPS